MRKTGDDSTKVPLTKKGTVWAMEMITQTAGFGEKEAFYKGNTVQQVYQFLRDQVGLDNDEVFLRLSSKGIKLNGHDFDKEAWEKVVLPFLTGAVVPLVNLSVVYDKKKNFLNPKAMPWNKELQGYTDGIGSKITIEGKIFSEIGEIIKVKAEEKKVALVLPEKAINSGKNK